MAPCAATRAASKERRQQRSPCRRYSGSCELASLRGQLPTPLARRSVGSEKSDLCHHSWGDLKSLSVRGPGGA
eukprot:361234-Prymnesium_polylepis.1